MRITAGTSVGVVTILVIAVLAAYVRYRAVWDSIGRVAVTDLGHRPPKYTSALNILVFGSDNRSRLTARQRALLHTGSDTENSTDSIMIVHVSPGRRGITVVNLPRDTMVPYYGCAPGAAAGRPEPGSRPTRARSSGSTRSSTTAGRRACGRPSSSRPASASTTSSSWA